MANNEKIDPALLDQLLKDQDPQKVFSSEGLLGDLKKALAERMLDAEMDVHLGSEDEQAAGNFDAFRSVLHHIVLPAIVLALGNLAVCLSLEHAAADIGFVALDPGVVATQRMAGLEAHLSASRGVEPDDVGAGCRDAPLPPAMWRSEVSHLGRIGGVFACSGPPGWL